MYSEQLGFISSQPEDQQTQFRTRERDDWGLLLQNARMEQEIRWQYMEKAEFLEKMAVGAEERRLAYLEEAERERLRRALESE